MINSSTRSKHPLDDLRHGLGVSPVDASAEYPQLPAKQGKQTTTGGAILLKAAEKFGISCLGAGQWASIRDPSLWDEK